jgi:hypothetical protein
VVRLGAGFKVFGMRWYNAFVQKLHPVGPRSSDIDIDAIRKRATTGTEISSHLETIYLEGISAKPSLIVELGVRTGESTFVLEKVAHKCGAALVSVDIDDCSGVCSYEKWHFVQEDDVEFGKRFPTWCENRGLGSVIDLLLVDTSHLYEHTVAEIRIWFPYLDTNLKRRFWRRDWTIGHAWDNDRGVVRALEWLLRSTLEERREFERQFDEWSVRHDPVCNGLTILKRTAAQTRS